MSFDYKKLLSKDVNIGSKEQKIRYGAGSALLLLSVFLGNIPLLILGGIAVATGFTRVCPVYSGLGKSTVDPNEPAATCGGGCGHGHGHGE